MTAQKGKRKRTGDSTWERFKGFGDRLVKEHQTLRVAVARLQKENCDLRREVRVLRVERRMAVAQAGRMRRIATQFLEEPYKGAKGKRVRAAMAEHSKD